MSRILCVWELGQDFGHMGRFQPLALKLRARGHDVVFALKDLSNAETVLGRHGFPLLQAPLWLKKVSGLPRMPFNYTELILQFGFRDRPGLTGLVKGWRELYGLVKPDLVLADHSPTALLAARGLPFRRALIGTGYCSPPRIAPLPTMRPWLTVDPERLVTVERDVLHTMNGVLADLGAQPMRAVADLFDADEDFLCTFPELDHYENRGPARYWGPAFAAVHGRELAWPETRGKRLFAYLKPEHRDFEKILGLLGQVKGAGLVFAPGISKALAEQYQSPRLTITTQPIKLDAILPDCDLAICHAGSGTCAAALLAGVPLLLLPTHVEQHLTASRVAKLGAGLFVAPRLPDETPPPKGRGAARQTAGEPDYRALLVSLLSGPGFTRRARAFAAAHADFNQAAQGESMVRRIEEILGAGA